MSITCSCTWKKDSSVCCEQEQQLAKEGRLAATRLPWTQSLSVGGQALHFWDLNKAMDEVPSGGLWRQLGPSSNHQKPHIFEEWLSYQTSVGWQERTVACGRLVTAGQPHLWCWPWSRWAATQQAPMVGGRQHLPKALGHGSQHKCCSSDTSINFLKEPTWIDKHKVYRLINTKVLKWTPDEPYTFLDL